MSIRTNDTDKIPYAEGFVTFIRWLPDHAIDACNDRATKREWLATGEKLFAAWTGQWRTDIFEIDTEAAIRALNPKQKRSAS